MSSNSLPYMPTEEALKFISFIRAAGVEDNNSPEIHYKLADKYFGNHKQVVIESFRGSAKALALNELVYLEEGGTKTIAEVQVGDHIYGYDGKPTKVLAKSEIFKNKDTYIIELSDGRVVTCSDDHLWSVKQKGSVGGLCKEFKTLTTKEMFNTQYYYRPEDERNPSGKESKYYLPLANPVEYAERDLPVDPYTIGVLIGDGSISKDTGYARVTVHNDDAEELFGYIPYEKGVNSTPNRSSVFIGLLGLGKRLKALGLNVNTYNKRIPEIYKRGSVRQRIELLQGLMDTDGTAGKYHSSFCTVNTKLAEDIYSMCTGLGLRVVMSTEANDSIGYHRLHITHKGFNPFKLKRKADKVAFKARNGYQKIKEIRRAEPTPSQCLVVDNDSKLFLTTNHVVTHNSTLMEWYVLYAAVNGRVANFGVVNFIAFVGDSAEGGVKNFFRNIQTKIDRSEFLQQFLSIKRCTNEEAELVNVNGHQLNIKGYGMRTNIRGVRYNGQRPEIVIMDDVTTNEALTSETIRKTISDNFYKAIMPALHPTHYRLFVIGTPIAENDILSKLRTNKKWVVHQFPVAEEFPCTREEFKGNWEDRFDYDAVLDKYETFKEDGELQSFYQEYMLEITDLSTLLVEEDDIQWFDPSQLVKHKASYNFYIVTDFATSTKKSADFSTIGVVAVSSNNDWLLVDGQCIRQTMQDNMDDLFRYVKKWSPLSVGIESSGQQGGFISILQEMMVSRNIWFTFAKKPGSKDPGIRPVKDKMHRFVTGVQPKFKQNKVWLPKPELAAKVSPRLFGLVEELLRELSRLTLAGGTKALAHDDAIDLLNQLSEMDLYAPTGSEELTSSIITDDGLVWTSVWGDDEESDGYTNSVIF